LPHAISMIALRKKPGAEWMTEDNMFNNPAAKAIAEKVKMVVDPLAEQVFLEENGLAIISNVEVKTVDGRIYQKKIKYSKGSPHNPLNTGELEEKFRILASSLFREKRIDAIIETVGSLDELDNISGLLMLLREE